MIQIDGKTLRGVADNVVPGRELTTEGGQRLPAARGEKSHWGGSAYIFTEGGLDKLKGADWLLKPEGGSKLLHELRRANLGRERILTCEIILHPKRPIYG